LWGGILPTLLLHKDRGSLPIYQILG